MGSFNEPGQSSLILNRSLWPSIWNPPKKSYPCNIFSLLNKCLKTYLLFSLWTEVKYGVSEHLTVDVYVLWLEVETWSRPNRIQAAVGHIDTALLHSSNQPSSLRICSCWEIYIKGETQASTAHISDPFWALLRNFVQFISEVLSRWVCIVHQILREDDLVLFGHQ